MWQARAFSFVLTLSLVGCASPTQKPQRADEISDFLVMQNSAASVVDVLNKAGIKATYDDTGLHIEPKDEPVAANILLTDPTLKDSGIVVYIPVRAGTGHRTADGVNFTMISKEM